MKYDGKEDKKFKTPTIFFSMARGAKDCEFILAITILVFSYLISFHGNGTHFEESRLQCISGSLSKYMHFFLFIFYGHQIFSFPFCFSLFVFPTLQWHIYIICSRENHYEKKKSRYVAPPHTFQSVVLIILFRKI